MFNKLIILLNIFRFKLMHIQFGKSLRIRGFIGIKIHNGGKISMGDYVTISSGNMSNPMARNMKAYIRVDENARLTIGNNVGMSSVSIWCKESIIIEDNVKIGALTIVSDNDAHSLDPVLRASPIRDAINAKRLPIKLSKNVFIGAMCYIGKGVNIGENSIVGAGSVVTKSIPANEIWGGNPARFIKKIDINENSNI
jgi:acetyltransferase-like isoleucine patch superfamily enzyme